MRHALIIFLNNGGYRIFYLKPNQDESDAKNMAFSILNKEGITEKDFKKILFLSENQMPSVEHHYCLEPDGDKVKINTSLVLETKIQLIRNKRNELLKELDNEYLIASRRNQQELIKEIEYKSQLLRDIPNKINKEQLNTLDKVSKFNPFGNVTKIKLIKDDNTYFSIPEVIIDPPNYGIRATAKVTIKNKKIENITIENNGYGYENPPKAIISNFNSILECELSNAVSI